MRTYIYHFISEHLPAVTTVMWENICTFILLTLWSGYQYKVYCVFMLLINSNKKKCLSTALRHSKGLYIHFPIINIKAKWTQKYNNRTNLFLGTTEQSEVSIIPSSNCPFSTLAAVYSSTTTTSPRTTQLIILWGITGLPYCRTRNIFHSEGQGKMMKIIYS